MYFACIEKSIYMLFHAGNISEHTEEKLIILVPVWKELDSCRGGLFNYNYYNHFSSLYSFLYFLKFVPCEYILSSDISVDLLRYTSHTINAYILRVQFDGNLYSCGAITPIQFRALPAPPKVPCVHLQVIPTHTPTAPGNYGQTVCLCICACSRNLYP